MWPTEDVEIAKAAKINPSYVSRVPRLTLLAPTTVRAFRNGRVDAAPTSAEAMKAFWSNRDFSEARALVVDGG
jgi:hypothetical protein